MFVLVFLPSFGTENRKKTPFPLICLEVDFCRKVGFGNFHLLNGNYNVLFFLHIINAVKITLLKCKMHQVLSISNRHKLWEPNEAKHIQD